MAGTHAIALVLLFQENEFCDEIEASISSFIILEWRDELTREGGSRRCIRK